MRKTAYSALFVLAVAFLMALAGPASAVGWTVIEDQSIGSGPGLEVQRLSEAQLIDWDYVADVDYPAGTDGAVLFQLDSQRVITLIGCDEIQCWYRVDMITQAIDGEVTFDHATVLGAEVVPNAFGYTDGVGVSFTEDTVSFTMTTPSGEGLHISLRTNRLFIVFLDYTPGQGGNGNGQGPPVQPADMVVDYTSMTSNVSNLIYVGDNSLGFDYGQDIPLTANP